MEGVLGFESTYVPFVFSITIPVHTALGEPDLVWWRQIQVPQSHLLELGSLMHPLPSTLWLEEAPPCVPNMGFNQSPGRRIPIRAASHFNIYSRLSR